MMVDELRTLLHEAVAVPPEDGTDVYDVARRGARARRRRQTLQAGLAAAAVAVVVGGAVLSGDLGRGSDATPSPAQRPGGTTLADAVPAEGRASLVAEVPVAAPDDAVLTGTTEDGLGLLWQEEEGPAGYSVRIGLLDPGTGETTWLPDSPAVLSEPLELGADRLVFLTEVPRVGPRVGIYDRVAGTWSMATWDGLRGSFTGAAMGPEGRVWFDQRGSLVSGSLTDPSDLREEGIAGAGFDIDDTTLVVLDRGMDPRSLTVVDLETREQRTVEFAARPIPCAAPSVDLGGDLIALAWSCGYSGTLADPQATDARALVITTDGDVVADVAALPGNLRVDASVAGDAVLLTSPSPSTTYDPDVCNFPFDGLATDYLDAWSSRTEELAEERDAADGWEYCQVSHEAYQELVLPHLGEAKVPEEGYGYYVVDGATGELVQLTRSTPYVAGWGFSGDGRVPTGSGLWEVP